MLRAILDRIVLLVSVVAAGCIPGFILQYRQRLGGRLDQALEDLALFQQIADRYHEGSLQALIQHHLASSDITFHAEGAAIQTMLANVEYLRATLQALNTDLAHQVIYLARHIDLQVAQATWSIYVPSFTLSAETVVFSLVVGIGIWLIFLAVWHLIAHLVKPRHTLASRYKK